jgi:hypothetical protein
MRAQEIMGAIDDKGQLSLDEPLSKNKQSRVKVIVLYLEENEDDEPKELILNSLRISLEEAKAGKTRPVSELWDGIDDE